MGTRLQPHLEIQGVRIPRILYGTAWKEERTQGLVANALEAGFRGIDTANQRKHYHEAAVGSAVQQALGSGAVKRPDLFLQTKFTYVNGQDHRLPYDPKAPLSTQVEQSFQSSLEHFGVQSLDAYLLHGPSFYQGLTKTDWETWGAMETLQRSGKTRLVGVSNVAADQLQALVEGASVKPAIVQNRCFTRPQADAAVRKICTEHGIAYEGFSLLTALTPLLRHPRIEEIRGRTGRTAAQIVFRYCLEAGMVILTGTSSKEHMRQDLAIFDLELEDEEIRAIASLVSGGRPR